MRNGTRLLKAAGSGEAALEAELLLMHALKLDRAHLYQWLADPLTSALERRYQRLLDRRLAHEPVPYIARRKEFFGLDFDVTPAALIPRPETETLVELAIAFVRGRTDGVLTIADVGTGCGAIAVSLAFNLRKAFVIATDVSKRALALAQSNAERHKVAGRVLFLKGNLLSPIERPVEIIAANLPYVTTADFLAAPPEIRDHEPRRALDGGPDGLTYIRKLLRQAPAKLATGGALFCEIGDTQGEAVRALARAAFPAAGIEIAPDLAGLDRVLCLYATPAA